MRSAAYWQPSSTAIMARRPPDRSFRTLLRIGRNSVHRLRPRNTRGAPGVGPGWHLLGIVERAGRDVDLIWMVRRLEGERRAARRTEGSCGVLRRAEALRSARDDPKRSRRHREPGHERRRTRAPADRTVARRRLRRVGIDLVADRAAEAAAFQHNVLRCGGLQDGPKGAACKGRPISRNRLQPDSHPDRRRTQRSNSDCSPPAHRACRCPNRRP